jgi:hypothetical protein
MPLLELPTDLLISIPNYLHNIEDFTNLSSSCRTLRTALSATTPSQILHLAAASSRTFFRPDPHFLIAATIRQVSDWALQNPANTEILRTAFKGGVEMLLQLCVEKAGLTMEEIRRLHLMRFSTFNPITDLIDRCAGQQWYSTPDFWDGGVSDANTVSCEPARAMFQIIIYGELFASSMRANLYPELNLPSFDIHVRLDYIRYCIPEWICANGSPGLGEPDQVGIFAGREAPNAADQYALNHLLHCRKWREAWEGVRKEIGEDFDLEWKQNMWHFAVQCQGLEGIEMMRPGGVEKWRERLVEIRERIESLERRPKTYAFGSHENPAAAYPHMADENFVCMAGYWQRDLN